MTTNPICHCSKIKKNICSISLWVDFCRAARMETLFHIIFNNGKKTKNNGGKREKKRILNFALVDI
jgi:hypothetical protein